MSPGGSQKVGAGRPLTCGLDETGKGPDADPHLSLSHSGDLEQAARLQPPDVQEVNVWTFVFVFCFPASCLTFRAKQIISAEVMKSLVVGVC